MFKKKIYTKNTLIYPYKYIISASLNSILLKKNIQILLIVLRALKVLGEKSPKIKYLDWKFMRKKSRTIFLNRSVFHYKKSSKSILANRYTYVNISLTLFSFISRPAFIPITLLTPLRVVKQVVSYNSKL